MQSSKGNLAPGRQQTEISPKRRQTRRSAVVLVFLCLIAGAHILGQECPVERVEYIFQLMQTRNNKEVIEALRSNSICLGVNSRDGRTLLNESIATGLRGVSRELVKMGADVNRQDVTGSTPLMFAAWYCDDELVKILIDRGADVNLKDSGGGTAVYRAVSNPECRKPEIVSDILRAGGSPTIRTEIGDVPVVQAAWNGKADDVRELVEAGADYCARDGEGESALDKAESRHIGRKRGHDEVVKYLKSLRPCKSARK